MTRSCGPCYHMSDAGGSQSYHDMTEACRNNQSRGAEGVVRISTSVGSIGCMIQPLGAVMTCLELALLLGEYCSEGLAK